MTGNYGRMIPTSPSMRTSVPNGLEAVRTSSRIFTDTGRPLRNNAGRTIRFVGHGPADQLGPVCAPQDRREAALQLKRALDERCPAWDIFIGDQLNAEENWLGMQFGLRVCSSNGPAHPPT